MELSPQAVSSFVVDLLNSTTNKTLKGAQIAQVLRIAFPSFSPMNFGCYNVRNFINKYAVTVREVGRAGADLIYSTAPLLGEEPTVSPAVGTPLTAPPAAAPPAATPPPAAPEPQRFQSRPRGTHLDSRVWKTFTTPHSPFRILANQQTGETRVLSATEPELGNPWVRVPSLTEEFHRELASEFLGSLRWERARKDLSDAMTFPKWWNQFYSVTLQLRILPQWNAFRTRKVLQKYHESLKLVGVPMVSEVDKRATREPNVVSRRPAQLQMFESDADAFLRKLVIKAVGRMTGAELRALSIPLGYIADDLGAS